MKYTTTIKEEQLVGGVRLKVKEGTVTDAEAKAIASDPWGKKLLDSGKLKFDKAVEVPTRPKLGMTVTGEIKHTNSVKTEAKSGK